MTLLLLTYIGLMAGAVGIARAYDEAEERESFGALVVRVLGGVVS